jgi:dTDP-4-dehydrorhamnose 3,5-epimerase
MEFIELEIPGLYIIKPRIFEDARGYFFESYNQNTFKIAGLNYSFVQDNQSKSCKHVLRGLHFQKPPFEQAKLVRVLQGSVLDIAVDLRKNSPNYGQWHGQILTEENKLMFFIPAGFAHGFLTLEEDTVFSYKCSNVYNKDSEGVIAWNDTLLNIDWGVTNPLVSERDANAPLFKDFSSPFAI